ncbi:DUF4231 domain-containing protein [Sphingomonas aerolata]|uniref:DUF4231 domain-containing protein n=1 Tax=Sphingomonas aerolata TaxID=185951 RepID=UPI00141BC00B|nr:DUF4231 domain-containing protein [Sphingomonas aerolata]NII59763.1 hypothetical protein [Sphingomonas aerolata]
MFEYPALYQTAGEMSAESQAATLNLIRGEYALLFLAAVLSMNWSKEPIFFVIYTGVLLGSLGLLIKRNSEKPEQGWYRGRALAESIKTSCWRYCMRAEPFGDADTVQTVKAEFRNHLLEILKTNRFIGDRMPPDSLAKEQIPDSMQCVRKLQLVDRKAFYLAHRIQEQREWYARKAGANKKAGRFWGKIGVLAYIVAITLALTRIALPDWKLWPIEPVLVFASSIIGWTQVKRFNELASSYSLTAHEIGIIQGNIDPIETEESFSNFINEAEQAFSREHTQWVARQQN